MATYKFSLIATRVDPKIAAELRYSLTETAYARQKLASKIGHWWPPLTYVSVGILRSRDWQKYIEALELYGQQLKRHQEEIDGGLIPFHVLVTNTSGQDDARVKIRLSVENGSIDVHKRPLLRPKRIDGAPDYVANKLHLRLGQISNFIRWHIHISRQRVEAEFSVLASDDSAMLVMPVLYLSSAKDTRLTYTIHSRNVPAEHGWVEFEDHATLNKFSD